VFLEEHHVGRAGSHVNSSTSQSIAGREELLESIEAVSNDLAERECQIIHITLWGSDETGAPNIVYDQTPEQVALDVRDAALDRSGLITRKATTLGRPFLLSLPDHLTDAAPLERTYVLQLLNTGYGSLICCPISLGHTVGHVLLGSPQRMMQETDVLAHASRLYQLLVPLFHRHPARRPLRLARALTKQETRILTLTAEGMTEKEIASDLTLSPHTVRIRVENAKRKLGARNKPHAVALFLSTQ